MPAQAPPVPDERSALVAYLRQQQDAFRYVLFGTTDEQAGLAGAGPSVLTLGALLKHVTQVQGSWLRQVLAAPASPEDGPDPETRYGEYEDAWTWRDDDTLEAALATYDEVCTAVLDAVATVDLDTPVPVPPEPWNPPDLDAWSVRWVWFHLIEELARHAGHADLVREAVDGATMYALIAGRDGWPATDWLTPWRPPADQAG